MVGDIAALVAACGAELIAASTMGVDGMDEMDDDMLSTCL
jgi:hypothetical protein